MTDVAASGWAGFDLARPLVMGILNATPDSFSGGGATQGPSALIETGLAMRAAGAAIIDVGGESTRPGAAVVPPDIEIARIVPVIGGLARDGATVSVDTRNAATMRAALDAGARIVNDVSGLRHDPAAAPLVAAAACPVILMHMRGTPATMSAQAVYNDVVADVLAELAATRDAALAAGIAPAAIALDPGFGFTKRGAQNVALLRALPSFRALGHPVLAGVSRKRFIGELAGEPDPARRDPGSIAAALFAAGRGAAIIRVHDVPGTVQALRVWQALADA
ncbi:dihydropteroate synthase [Acidiphilium multivorum AIU301]|uniref:dihydropteroate synthase n=1 Tax=Acidiphilium multivorum (strain DSM 11245 / JCM 8867 / NBRC 100883 / AIU 301) TaxID=926570 RepID=F0IX34_ACIMA|nr:dihydropteroate synthase [Acidiphilium multivorum]BAJ80444.1 dihydropteroate synthase [Acidiphilium multivorum AIU301]GAN73802.1 dihydropteroate synthase [Acidiphilium multivorum AIU301]